jgi:cytoskeletal protein CcmA (bactofilin family)
MGKGNKDANQINGLIDRGCSVEGKLTFDGTVQINGDFRGEILSDGTLIVGTDARLNAKIQVDTIVIEGNVEGQIEAKQKIELRRGATLIGDISSPAFAVEEGAVFHGRCQMLQGEPRTGERGVPAAQGMTYAEEGEDALMM